MFSPSQNNTTPTVRTSRRRARPLSNEANFSLPKAKRQRSARSALSDTTFTPPDGAPEMEEIKASTVARRESVREPALPAKEMVVRGKKSRSADRGSKGDGSVVLVGL
jgi:nuclear pore complex protein Nup133